MVSEVSTVKVVLRIRSPERVVVGQRVLFGVREGSLFDIKLKTYLTQEERTRKVQRKSGRQNVCKGGRGGRRQTETWRN